MADAKVIIHTTEPASVTGLFHQARKAAHMCGFPDVTNISIQVSAIFSGDASANSERLRAEMDALFLGDVQEVK